MGVPLSRIEKEFVLKSILEEKVPINVHGPTWDIHGMLSAYSDFDIEIEMTYGDLETPATGDGINVFYSFQNNNLTFSSLVQKKKGNVLIIKQPEEIFKNSHRGYIRVKMNEKINAFFYVQSKRYELSFPRISTIATEEKPVYAPSFDSTSIADLVRTFQKKMQDSVSEHRIILLKDRLPEAYEEKLLMKYCKILWIPSTSRELPPVLPFFEDKVILKSEIEQFEIDMKTAPFHVESRIKDFLFQKKLKGIFSEAYCPVFFRDYLVGYIYIMNKDNLKREISEELLDYTDQFAKVLSYSLRENGYFKSHMNVVETKYEAPIIDLSASGLLFAHGSADLDKELLVFKELKVNFEISTKKLMVDSWIIRKFKDLNRYYFGLQFRKMDQDDFCFLYEFLYRKPFAPQGKYTW